MTDDPAAQNPADPAPAADEPIAEPAADATPDPDPQARIAELEAELAAVKDQMLRALADAENTRRRADRDRADAVKYGAAGLAKELLAVADNFARALESAPADESLKGFVTGVEMTGKQLQDALAKNHVRRLNPLGEKMDPNLHQAMMEMESPEVPPGHVAQVMQDGYVLHDRLLRPAMVAVSKGPPSVDKTI
ncbi:MAG: nucleotide exchange factor GrpE [Pseudomonadota bacterium]